MISVFSLRFLSGFLVMENPKTERINWFLRLLITSLIHSNFRLLFLKKDYQTPAPHMLWKRRWSGINGNTDRQKKLSCTSSTTLPSTAAAAFVTAALVFQTISTFLQKSFRAKGSSSAPEAPSRAAPCPQLLTVLLSSARSTSRSCSCQVPIPQPAPLTPNSRAKTQHGYFTDF